MYEWNLKLQNQLKNSIIHISWLKASDIRSLIKIRIIVIRLKKLVGWERLKL